MATLSGSLLILIVSLIHTHAAPTQNYSKSSTHESRSKFHPRHATINLIHKNH